MRYSFPARLRQSVALDTMPGDHPLPGGAATIAAATAPDVVSGIVELGPFTRKVQYSLSGMLRVRRYRRGTLLMGAALPNISRSLGPPG